MIKGVEVQGRRRQASQGAGWGQFESPVSVSPFHLPRSFPGFLLSCLTITLNLYHSFLLYTLKNKQANQKTHNSFRQAHLIGAVVGLQMGIGLLTLLIVLCRVMRAVALDK